MIPDANDVAQSYFDALMQQPIRDDSSNPTTNITMALVMEQLEQRMTAVLRELDKSLSDSQQSAALLTMKLQNYQNTQHKIEASLSVENFYL